ncbi:MAG: peptide ABC transporter substrate-binding protein, partial [Bdellovibrionales bacterium]|nr:peptide ABC transporter substrate-binding protein [Bdellovibrionales bacterium]
TLCEKSKVCKSSHLSFAYSVMGGDDIKRTVEWIQHQWKQNLSISVELFPVEQGYYLKQLSEHSFDLFRKGVGLDRPTCLAALQNFLPDHPENYLDLKDPKFQQVVEELEKPLSERQRRQACSKAISILIEHSYLIPLGEMHFAILAKPQFTGWRLNEMNQLDLTDLRPALPENPVSN